MRHCWLLLPLLTLPATAADPPKHRAEGDAAIAARRVLIEHCAPCHGDSDPKKRQGRLWVNDWTTLVGNAGNAGPIAFVSLDREDLRSQVVEFMKDGSMPPGGRKAVPKEQIAAVENWLRLGATEYPTRFDDERVLEMVVTDLGRVPEKERGGVRYVSLAHLVEKPGGDLARAEAELVAALTARPRADAGDVVGTVLKPVPGSAGTLFRLDIKALGWGLGEKYLFERTEAGSARDEEFRMVPFDLIQLEYPYAHAATDAGLKGGVTDALVRMNAHRKTEKKDPLAQLRAVPFVRGDWLAAALRRDGRPTPLANDLDSLVRLSADLVKSTDRFVGDGPEFVPFLGGVRVNDATAPPVWAWYQSEVGPTPPPFQFTAATEDASPLKENGSFKLTATCDRPVVVSLVEVQVDYVDVLKFDNQTRPAVAVDMNRPTPISPNDKGGNKDRIQPTITAANKGKPLYYLLYVSGKASPHREPVVVRSRHESKAVWRVLPNESDAAEGDRPPPIRKVVQVEAK